MYVVCRAGNVGCLLCNDRRWRSLLHWGDSDGCVKEFKTMGWAWRAARRIGGEVYEYHYWKECMNIYASIDQLVQLARKECDVCAREVEQTAKWMRALHTGCKSDSNNTEKWEATNV